MFEMSICNIYERYYMIILETDNKNVRLLLVSFSNEKKGFNIIIQNI